MLTYRFYDERLRSYRDLYRGSLLNDVIPFWLKYARDDRFGGIATCVDRRGNCYSGDKGVWMQGRTAWTFSRLCNQYGARPEWLEMAKSCVDFLNDHCFDPADGRMYFTVTRDGAPIRKRRYIYSECFYIMGCAEYAKASGDPAALENARRLYDSTFAIYLDPAADPFKPEPKFLPQTRAMRAFGYSMILLNVTSVLRGADPERIGLYDERARRLIDDIFRYYVRPDLKAVLENVGTDGAFLDDCSIGRVVNGGHDLEGVWFLADEAVHFNDRALLDRLPDIYDWAYRLGWDPKYGGFYNFVDVKGFPPEQYEHDMKMWWGVNEAIIAALKMYRLLGDERYLERFESLTEHAFRYYADPEYGEWFGYLRRDNQPTEPPCKGGIYKGPFHVPRMMMEVDRMLDADA